MKNFIKGRWFPFFLLLVSLVFVLLVSFLLGFRITYAPALENSWEAISGVAAWVGILVSIASVGASLAAVWAAIQVPKKIAEKQDSISLFEKRYELYSELYKWYYLAEQIITYAQNNDQAREMFDILYNDFSKNIDSIRDRTDIMYRGINEKINQARFLFPLEKKDCEDLSSFIIIMWGILIGYEFPNHYKDLKNKFESDEFKKIFATIERELSVAKMR